MYQLLLQTGMNFYKTSRRTASCHAIAEIRRKSDKSRRYNPAISYSLISIPIPKSCFHKGKITSVKKFNLSYIICITKTKPDSLHNTNISEDCREREIAKRTFHSAYIQVTKRTGKRTKSGYSVHNRIVRCRYQLTCIQKTPRRKQYTIE